MRRSASNACICFTWVILKVTRFIEISYFRQSILNKILAPNVFNYEDLPFTSIGYEPPANSFCVMENLVFINRRCSTIIKII